ncbi:MAG: radical SAM family heme chaperone HemW [Oscillospiraceae bacterium]|nr:radical SAM family heme chaperone HemW [Oscillospiraceae bacterium]
MALLQRKNKIPLGIYVHVPFCRSKCQYCDFYSVTNKKDLDFDGYTQAVCTHIKEAGMQAPNHIVDTIYFGGGTPSFFGGEGMAMILAAIRKNFDVSPTAEITFEANPDSVTDRLLRRVRGEGFNRVSLGIQCDNDNILKTLGRPHTYAEAVTAVKKLRKKGFRNISVDLIYGLPGQRLQDWNATLNNVLSLKPEHISCYGLQVEEGTPLYNMQEFYNLADDDAQADMYLSAVEILRKHGYHQYEISNFCKKGHTSRHNMKYWTGGEYLGFGPGASSDFGGSRFSMVRDVHRYIEGVLQGGTVVEELQEVAPRERAAEYLMMRLRTTAGIDRETYENTYLLPFAPLEDLLLTYKQQNLAVQTYDGRWHLTARGFLLSNSIISDLLLVQERSKSL